MIIEFPKYFRKEDIRITGVYFLMKGKYIVYIGQTTNILNRMKAHTDKDFDKIRLIECGIDLLDYYERRLIRLFKPKYNLMDYTPIIGKTRSIRIPKDVDKKLAKRAKTQGRSINSQIVFELEGNESSLRT